MATEKGTETVANDGNNQTPGTESAAAPPPADDTVQVRRGEYSGLKTQLKQLQKWKEEQEAAKSQEDQAKLKAAQDWETLEKKMRSDLDSAKAEVAAQKRAVVTERARNALLGAGMNAGLAVEGALSTLPADIEPEAISAWLEEVRAKHPDAFTAPRNPIGAPSVGAAVRPTGNDAASLRAKWEASRGKGPDARRAVQREIDAFMANGGKNPLV